MNMKKPSRLLNSRAYKKATGLVNVIIKSPDRAGRLVEKAKGKFNANKTDRLSQLWDSLSAIFRLIQAYVSGEYREISLESVALIVACVTYFVMPFDVMPDFIVGIGLIDDAALISWTVRAVASDLAQFIAWEESLKEQVNTSKIEANSSE